VNRERIAREREREHADVFRSSVSFGCQILRRLDPLVGPRDGERRNARTLVARNGSPLIQVRQRESHPFSLLPLPPLAAARLFPATRGARSLWRVRFRARRLLSTREAAPLVRLKRRAEIRAHAYSLNRMLHIPIVIRSDGMDRLGSSRWPNGPSGSFLEAVKRLWPPSVASCVTSRDAEGNKAATFRVDGTPIVALGYRKFISVREGERIPDSR